LRAARRCEAPHRDSQRARRAEARAGLVCRRGSRTRLNVVLTAEPLADFLNRARVRVDEALARILPTPPACPAIVSDAMRYSVFAGGKRLRPILTLAAADAVTSAGHTRVGDTRVGDTRGGPGFSGAGAG